MYCWQARSCEETLGRAKWHVLMIGIPMEILTDNFHHGSKGIPALSVYLLSLKSCCPIVKMDDQPAELDSVANQPIPSEPQAICSNTVWIKRASMRR